MDCDELYGGKLNMLHINREEADQLRQLCIAGEPGVVAGELMSRRVTRNLVRARWADNNGQDASSLNVVRINTAGRRALTYYDDPQVHRTCVCHFID